jgi:hypothetical protein
MAAAAGITSSYFSFRTTINDSSTPKKIVVSDTTSLTTLINAGYALSGAFIRVEFEDSSGKIVMYDNLNGSLTGGVVDVPPGASNVNDIPAILNSDGSLSFGTYTVTAKYTYIDVGAPDPPIVIYDNTLSTSHEFKYVCPKAVLAYKLNLAASNLRVTDRTNYGSYTALARQLTISPPGAAQQPPLSLPVQTTSQPENIYVNITSGTWSMSLYSVVTAMLVDADNGLDWEVICEVRGCIEKKIFTSVDLNKLLCCLQRHKERYETHLNKGTSEAKAYYEQIIVPMILNMTFYALAGIAGCEEDANAALDRLKKITGCKDCECDDGDRCPTPIPVITGATFLYTLDSPRNTISVTVDVQGDTTNWHIDISPSILNQLANIKQYVAVGQSPITVVTTTSPDGKIVTFTVGLNRPMPQLQNLSAVLATLSNDGVNWALSSEEIFVDTGGGVVNPFASQVIALIPGPAGSTAINSTDAIAIRYGEIFNDFYKFVVRAQVINVHNPFTYATLVNPANGYLKQQKTIEAGVLWIENNSDAKGKNAVIRLYNPVNGEPVMWQDLNEIHAPLSLDTKIQIRIEAIAKEN